MSTPAYDCLVIGSGPAGVACALALLAAGRRVHMVDAGLALEPERAEMLAEARARGPVTVANAPWLAEQKPAAKIPRKLIYGSDFPFRDASEALRLHAADMGAEPSFAHGGLSNVWGASALPYAAADTQDWPVSAADLAPHYAACAEMLGLAAEEDDLAEWLPLHAPPRGQLRASRQAQRLLSALTHNRESLLAQGVRFGRARVAARAQACTYCGLCLHGCPDKLIYTSAASVESLKGDERFSHQGDVVIETLADGEVGARAQGYGRVSRAPIEFNAARVFVAAGALSSTALLLRSAQAYDRTLIMQDSQYFLLPMVLFRGAGRAREERLHTMAQLFLELRDPDLSPYTIHLQVYTYNDLMARTMRARLGSWLEPLARWGDAHFVLIQGYLHSAHSGSIAMTLRRQGDRDRIDAQGVANPEVKRIIGKLVRKLIALSPRIGAVPVPPLMEIAEPGRGFHIGGALPMRAAPGAFESDTLGSPFGWRRVHVVDATVLPSVPATTITFPVMANAHRIGALSGAEA